MSKKQANKLRLDNTIDIKYMVNAEYCRKVTRERFIKKLTRAKRWLFLFLAIFGLFAYLKMDNAYSGDSFIDRFPEEKIVIGCYNSNTQEVRKSSKCLLNGDHNITLPSKEDIKIWLKYYNEKEIINRLALVNFESNFNENAENNYAKGYVQTLKKWGIAPDIDSQLAWLKNRQDTHGQEYYYGMNGLLEGCGIYWSKDNVKDGFSKGEYGVLACLYRYHYNANTGSWYAKRGVIATRFYKEYFSY